ncbi:hypothetical protein BJX61DRAFT_532695 [Aspergillus egyptiacus]|nr:hypothetical protein BJX61DRAFT_532695 [Aspergillus egyptiacus]
MANFQPVEEQAVPPYPKSRTTYQLRIADSLKDQYRLLAMLGYGAYSAIWLAWNEMCIEATNTEAKHIPNEIRVLQRLKSFAQAADHLGLNFTRLATDRIPKLLGRFLVHCLVFFVNWFHATCGVIHTYISSQNVLTEIEDDISLKDFESRKQRTPVFPLAATHEGLNNDCWMSDLYRAPEVLLKLRSVMMLELLEGRKLFDPIDQVHGQYVPPLALAQYIGKWISDPPILKTSVEALITTVPPANEVIPDERLMRRTDEML